MGTSPAGTQGANGNTESDWSLDARPELAGASDRGLGVIALPATPLFGTDGIRGRVGELLGVPLALQVGFWTGLVLQTNGASGPVIVGAGF